MVQEQIVALTQLPVPQCHHSGAPSQIILFTPGTGMVPGRTIVAASAAIGRLLRSVATAPTAWASSVATSTPGRVAAPSTTDSQSAAWLSSYLISVFLNPG